MKPSNTSAPHVRLTCQVVRFWSSVRENPSPPHHFETCESCQHFLVSAQQLHRDLQLNARQFTATPPSGMEGRIIDAIRLSTSSPRESSPRRSLTLALAGGLAAVVFASLWQSNFAIFTGHQTGASADYTAEVAALVTAVRSFPGNFSQTLAAPTAQLAQDNSLGREVENVYSDARSALDFLELNFLPNSGSSDSTSGRENASAQQT